MRGLIAVVVVCILSCNAYGQNCTSESCSRSAPKGIVRTAVANAYTFAPPVVKLPVQMVQGAVAPLASFHPFANFRPFGGKFRRPGR